MIRRLVVFKMKDEEGVVVRNANASGLVDRFLALKKSLPFLVDLQCGVNVNPDGDHQVGLTVVYRSWDDIDAYTVHPDHVVVKEYVQRTVASRTIVDFIV